MASPSSSSAPLIKGYLPVRLRIPASAKRGSSIGKSIEDSSSSNEESFLYVREHRGKQQHDDGGSSSLKSHKHGTTLFVANAPVVPGISTKLLLKSLFGRFASVQRVTVVQNPRGGNATESTSVAVMDHNSQIAFDWTAGDGDSSTAVTSSFYPTFLPPILSEGKFAHVVFETPKDLKRAKKALEDTMKSARRSKNKRHKTTTNSGGAIELDEIEIQTLADESHRQWEEQRRGVVKGTDDSGDESDSDNDEAASDSKQQEVLSRGGVLAVAQRYRDSLQLLSRSRLMEECNKVMTAYEEAEDTKRRQQVAANAQPDDDGFVTVSYAAAVGSKAELEQSMTATTPSRRKGNKRSRKKKEAIGSTELKDFYRFQRRENRKRTMDDLRKQFEEDLKRVKRLKEEK
ncbi:MAG: hypothetical protein SGARI_003880, partial [Bacillariaceae sp.]